MARQGQGPGSRSYRTQGSNYNQHPYKGRPSGSHKRTGGNPPPKKGCCPMVAALRSVKQGKFRLAGRYARMSARLIAARMV